MGCPRLGSGLALLLLAALALPAQARIALELPPDGVDFGTPFELRLVRAWPRQHTPQPFDPAALLPLDVRELSATVVSVGDDLVETRRFLAAAWRRDHVALTPLLLRTRDASGREHTVEHQPAPLPVRSSLPVPPGAIEWPGDVRDRPTAAVWPFALLGATLLVLGGIGWRHRRRPVAAVEPAGPTAAELARGELAALAVPSDDAGLEAFYIALAEIVRRFCERRFGVRAVVHTSEELLAVVPAGTAPLQQCLWRCDLVKFAADRPAAPVHGEARAAALAFVDQNAAEPA